MSHYSDDPSSVRVDFWKANGKWYSTEAVKWTGGYSDVDLFDAFRQSLFDHLWCKSRLVHSGMTATCLEPYHEHSHPIQVTVDSCAFIANRCQCEE